MKFAINWQTFFGIFLSWRLTSLPSLFNGKVIKIMENFGLTSILNRILIMVWTPDFLRKNLDKECTRTTLSIFRLYIYLSLLLLTHHTRILDVNLDVKSTFNLLSKYFISSFDTVSNWPIEHGRKLIIPWSPYLVQKLG